MPGTSSGIYKYTQKHTHTDVSKYFFNNRVVDKWNALNEETVQAETIASFKKKYDNEVKAKKSREGNGYCYCT